MKTIQILGTGCPACTRLFEQASLAAKELGIEYTIEKITDIDTIVEMGATLTPALAIDGVVKASGTHPSKEKIQKWLSS